MSSPRRERHQHLRRAEDSPPYLIQSTPRWPRAPARSPVRPARFRRRHSWPPLGGRRIRWRSATCSTAVVPDEDQSSPPDTSAPQNRIGTSCQDTHSHAKPPGKSCQDTHFRVRTYEKSCQDDRFRMASCLPRSQLTVVYVEETGPGWRLARSPDLPVLAGRVAGENSLDLCAL